MRWHMRKVLWPNSRTPLNNKLVKNQSYYLSNTHQLNRFHPNRVCECVCVCGARWAPYVCTEQCLIMAFVLLLLLLNSNGYSFHMLNEQKKKEILLLLLKCSLFTHLGRTHLVRPYAFPISILDGGSARPIVI